MPLYFFATQDLQDISAFSHSEIVFISTFKTDLVLFSGVVFNEMKGVYSQPDNILGRTAQQASFFFSWPFVYVSLQLDPL